MKLVTNLANLGIELFKYTKPKAQKFWYYAKVELAPPKISEIPIAIREAKELVHFMKSGGWKELTMKEAFLNAMVTIEVILWFTMGKCIGKRSLVGYQYY